MHADDLATDDEDGTPHLEQWQCEVCAYRAEPPVPWDRTAGDMDVL